LHELLVSHPRLFIINYRPMIGYGRHLAAAQGWR
jgi:hypothetical protein